MSNIMAGWQDALEAGELRFPKCRHCAAWNWYPLPRCRACGSDEFHWTKVEPLGVVHSWTRVHRVFSRDHDLVPPYTVAIIDMTAAAGVRLTCLQRPESPEPVIGDLVELTLEQGAKGPKWTFACRAT